MCYYILWRTEKKAVSPLRISRRYITIAYKISEDCIGCGACAAECPVGAISEADGKYAIDASACLDCGACAGTCPVGAPQAE